jgi:hypothetical protein
VREGIKRWLNYLCDCACFWSFEFWISHWATTFMYSW